MMLPTLNCTTRFVTRMDNHNQQHEPLNCPVENDETMSDEFLSGCLPEPHSGLNCSPGINLIGLTDTQPLSFPHTSYQPPRLPLRLADGYSPQTPHPSLAEMGRSTLDAYPGAWHHYPSYASSSGGYPNSLPSCRPSAEYPSYLGDGSYPQSRSQSLPDRHIPSIGSLEQPGSLHSIPSTAARHNHPLSAYPFLPQGPPCCARCPPGGIGMGPVPYHSPRPGYQLHYGFSDPNLCRHEETGATRRGYPAPHREYPAPHPRQASLCSLSQEQRKVFVTYETDSDEHVKEIIKFVALLRNNGFDTHIDVFEQQLNSISKIDCMEKYINEKDYLIIIIISPKYYETVTGANVSLENDERTLNTVYIHKQLQNEFIQNGCKNFRFIPILFPGAKKSYVPAWLQNTHIYSWPANRDDVLRRLMRVEKYNPPPIGPLPTIVSIPI